MNNKITRVFQGLTLTTFSMAVYNTVNGLKAKQNMVNSQDLLNEINTNIKNQSANQVFWQSKVEEKLDLISKSKHINQSQMDAVNNVGEGLKGDLSVYQQLANRFKDSENIEQLAPEELVKLLKEFKEKGDKLANSGENLSNELSKILDEINKGSGSGTKYLSDVSDFLSSLTFEQTVAIVNITGCLAIIISLISLFSIFYGNILIDRFQLEKSYPKVARFIQWRRKFQFYYSLIDFILIFTVASIIIYINLLIYVQ